MSVTEDRANKQGEKYAFLLDMNIKVKGSNYLVKSIKVVKENNQWNTLLVCDKIDIHDYNNSNYETCLSLFEPSITSEPSILIFETINLDYTEYGAVRLIEIVKLLLSWIPPYKENKLIIEKLRSFEDYQSTYYTPNGHELFNEVKTFILNQVQCF